MGSMIPKSLPREVQHIVRRVQGMESGVEVANLGRATTMLVAMGIPMLWRMGHRNQQRSILLLNILTHPTINRRLHIHLTSPTERKPLHMTNPLLLTLRATLSTSPRLLSFCTTLLTDHLPLGLLLRRRTEATITLVSGTQNLLPINRPRRLPFPFIVPPRSSPSLPPMETSTVANLTTLTVLRPSTTSQISRRSRRVRILTHLILLPRPRIRLIPTHPKHPGT